MDAYLFLVATIFAQSPIAVIGIFVALTHPPRVIVAVMVANIGVTRKGHIKRIF